MRGTLMAALAMAVGGCLTTHTGMVVDLALSSVQRPQDVAERWGDYVLAPADSLGFTYEDGLLSLAVVPLAGTFSVVLENRTEHSIRLLWGEASYVGPSGLSSGVVPGETRWIDMGNAPAPQVIPSRARAAITVIPRINANTSTTTIENFYADSTSCDQVPGTMLRLILPIEIQGVANEYTLHFEPLDAASRTWKSSLGVVQEETRSETPCDIE